MFARECAENQQSCWVTHGRKRERRDWLGRCFSLCPCGVSQGALIQWSLFKSCSSKSWNFFSFTQLFTNVLDYGTLLLTQDLLSFHRTHFGKQGCCRISQHPLDASLWWLLAGGSYKWVFLTQNSTAGLSLDGLSSEMNMSVECSGKIVDLEADGQGLLWARHLLVSLS